MATPKGTNPTPPVTTTPPRGLDGLIGNTPTPTITVPKATTATTIAPVVTTPKSTARGLDGLIGPTPTPTTKTGTATTTAPPVQAGPPIPADLRAKMNEVTRLTRLAERYKVPQSEVESIVKQEKINPALNVLGKVINFDVIPGGLEFKPVEQLLLKPLMAVDTGRRLIQSTLKETGDELAVWRGTRGRGEEIDPKTGNPYRLGAGGFSWKDWLDQTKNYEIGYGQLMGDVFEPEKDKPTKWQWETWANRGIGLVGDIFTDPVTFMTAGTGKVSLAIAKEAAREGVVVSTRQTAAAAAKAAAKAGEAAVVQAGKEGIIDAAEIAARKAAAEAAVTAPVKVGAGAFGIRPQGGATSGLSATQKTAAEAILEQQRIGARRTLGARTREELAQIAREVREAAKVSGNEFVVNTLTDDVIGEIATRGYSALRGPVAEVLGARGGLRFGAGKFKVILPYTEKVANTIGQTLTSVRVGTKNVPITVLNSTKLAQVASRGLFGTEAGRRFLSGITPTGEGGVFGSADIARMRVALRSGVYEGRKLTGQEANDFVKLLAMDRAYGSLFSQSTSEAQQLLRPVFNKDANLLKYSNTVFDILDNPKAANLLDPAFDVSAAASVVGREVSEEELALAKNLRSIGDEFYNRANYLHNRAQVAAGVPFEQIQPLPKNQAWFPHTLSKDAALDIEKGRLPEKVLNELGVDRSYALAGSNLRQLKAGELFFGKRLTQADIDGGIKSLNEIARKFGKLSYDFFETNAEEAFTKYARGFSRDTAYTNWLHNLALVTESERGNVDSFLGKIAEAEGAGPFVGKGFGGDLTQESIKTEFGVRPPSKLLPFADAATEILSPARVDALNQTPKFRTELESIRDEIVKLADEAEVKLAGNQTFYSDFLNQKINQLEQRILDLQRLAPDLPAGYGAAMSAEAKALADALQNESGRLVNALQNVPPDKWAKTVPLFLDNASAFLQINAQKYPGLLASPQIKEMITNFRRLEDPFVARLMPQWYKNTTQLFKSWVTAIPGFHERNALSNVFFMLSAGASPLEMRRATKVYMAYTKFLKKRGLESLLGLGGDEGVRALVEGAAKRELGITSAVLTTAEKDLVDKFLLSPRGEFLQRQLMESTSAGNKSAMEFLLSDEFAKTGLDIEQVVNKKIAGLNPQRRAEINNLIAERDRLFAESDKALRAGDDFAANDLAQAAQAIDGEIAGAFKTLGTDIDTYAKLLFATGSSGFGVVEDVFGTGTGAIGISGRGQTRTVQGAETLGEKAVGAGAEISRRFAKPLSWSRKEGQAIEQWSRFALTWDGLAKGLTPDEAAARTAKYLIDYQDLSQADRGFKQIIPFWMWTSRSFPLILESSWANPRAYATWNSIVRNATDKEDTSVRPGYLQYSFKLPFGRNIFANPDFGFQKQEDAFGNLTDPASMLGALAPVPRAIVEAGLNFKFKDQTQIYNPNYQTPVAEEIKYIVNNVLPFLGYYKRLGNATAGAIQNPAIGGAALAGGIAARTFGLPTSLGLAGGAVAGAGAEPFVGQLPGAGVVQNLPGLGKPGYIEEKEGKFTPEESRQYLFRLLGIPGYELQPYEQSLGYDSIIKQLEEVVNRAKNKKEEERKNK
jgi:hypothetical protein